MRAGVGDALELRLGSVWDAIGGGEDYHVIVSNPPYVADTERSSLMPEVRDHEPADALFAGPDGLAVIREIVAGAGAHLRPGALLALEVGSGQAATVVALLEEAGFAAPRVAQDLAGRERIVLAVHE